jgi:HD-like signal output (HDOD) protein
MSTEASAAELLSELRHKGHLPALDANVATICALTGDPLIGAAELTSVILRDPALTANIISTANSALYHPAEPIKTVSAATLIMGFDCVRTLALGLSIVKQMGQTAQNRNLFRLFACSYFSGMFAMALGQRAGHKTPEELLVAGVLSQLPRLLLAHAFPDRYATLEHRMATEKLPFERACREVFGVSYGGLSGEIARFWNLPASVARHVRGESGQDATSALLRHAGQVADMMFGNQSGGSTQLLAAERELQALLEDPGFKLGEFIGEACAADPNVLRFFRLSSKDVDMMVKIVEWGKVNPAEVASNLTFGPPDEAAPDKAVQDPAVLIGQYLTELMKAIRRGPDINRVLLTGLEAIYRCAQPACVLLAFPDAAKQRLQGRFLLGSGGKAGEFHADLQNETSPVARCWKSQQPLQASARRDLPESFLTRAGLDSVFLSPIVVGGNAIGLCVVARAAAVPFAEQEQAWIDTVVDHIATAFERSRARSG